MPLRSGMSYRSTRFVDNGGVQHDFLYFFLENKSARIFATRVLSARGLAGRLLRGRLFPSGRLNG